MNLPELPEPDHSSLAFVAFRTNKSPIVNYYTESQMLALRAATVEACAAVCENEAWRLKKVAIAANSGATNGRSIQASNCADAIRGLK